jgi:hypothetical protein
MRFFPKIVTSYAVARIAIEKSDMSLRMAGGVIGTLNQTFERRTKMKRLVLLVVGLVLLGMVAAPAYADTQGAATAAVVVNVNPNVSLSAKTPLVNAGTIQTGDFFAQVTWTIGANLEQVAFFLEASDLYKGDDPVNVQVAPIALNTNKPAEFAPQFGSEINAGDNKALWVTGAGASIGAYPTKKTETATFESSQNGHYSQDVTTKIFYNQPDPEKTVGQYSGKVRLTALLVGVN